MTPRSYFHSEVLPFHQVPQFTVHHLIRISSITHSSSPSIISRGGGGGGAQCLTMGSGGAGVCYDFSYLIFSLCYHRMTCVYHADTRVFPHSLCAALYMLHPLLCLTSYMLFPCLYHMFTLLTPCCCSMDIYYINWLVAMLFGS